jgi:sugar phosphate isomerase/epimerase
LLNTKGIAQIIVDGSGVAGFYVNDGRAAERSATFKLGVITDEVSDDLDQALDFIINYGLHYCELRDMWGKNIMSLSRRHLDHAKHLIDDYGLKVSDIGSRIFKYNLSQMSVRPERQGQGFDAAFTEEDSDCLLLESFDLAHFFGTPKVRVFSYRRVKAGAWLFSDGG